ncbi:CobW family GTP-binding protein [Pseudomonas syringae group sp. J309-1]|uniref:CobW family GTP-binding protein n=1 Tax=Pseudomonas syringae group sp. J309-1 TaxID=3079588 RepID=UPI00290870B3|nr:CobW family GTP-binding protein [Pseudomonas syringae group sp. J309-1]MDU8358930.1 CobW family GTP-binding protein [Pseudomonas syringae group sp. J309-1]
MLQNIPTHVIGGPLGAGKTSLIKHLLAQKPADERWAILINEFGQIGLDAALLTKAADGIALGEVAGGCLCCVNGAPFQIGLGRLLRKSRPHRLLIEPSGLGHPVQLIEQLQQAPWLGVLTVQPSVMVLDVAALATGHPLPPSQASALTAAGLLVLNKSADLDAAARRRLIEQLPASKLIWTEQGRISLAELPGISARPDLLVDKSAVDNLAIPKSLGQLPAVWADPVQPICLSQAQQEGWSIGWRWHPSQRFDLARLEMWLQGMTWRRAKLVINSGGGWVSGNVVAGDTVQWQVSEWRRDSRLELIFTQPQDEPRLQAELATCLL